LRYLKSVLFSKRKDNYVKHLNLRLLAEKNGLTVQKVKHVNGSLSGSIVNLLNIKFNLKITDFWHFLALLFLPFDIFVNLLSGSSNNVTMVVVKK